MTSSLNIGERLGQAHPNAVHLFIFATLIFVIHLTGDHVFNKTNTLKMVLLGFSATLLLIVVLAALPRSQPHGLKVLFFLSLPLMATLPGWIVSGGRYDYALPYELAAQSLCVIWAYLTYRIFAGAKDVSHLVWCFMPVIILVCAVALMERAGLDPLLRLGLNPFEAVVTEAPVAYMGPAKRVASTFGNSNYFAGFLIQLIPVVSALTIVVWGRHRRQASSSVLRLAVLMIALVAMLVSLHMTGTRAAMAAFLVAITVFSALYFLLIRHVAVGYLAAGLVLVTVVTVIVVGFATPQLMERFLSLAEYNAWRPRLVAWQAAWNSFLEAPVFGYGIGASYELFFNFVDAESGLWGGGLSYNHVHSEILEVLQEGGVLGLIVYLAVWGGLFLCGWGLVRDKAVTLDVKILVIGVLCGLLAYHLHGLFSVAPRMVATRMVAYTLIAIVFVLAARHAKCKLVLQEKRVLNGWANMVVICVLGITWAWLIPYAHSQHGYAKALASPPDHAMLFDLADESAGDVYILDEAARRALELQDGALLQRYSDRIAERFFGYRRVDVYRAEARYLQGDFEGALKLANQAQARNPYSSETQSLLMKLAYMLDRAELFREQLAFAVKVHGCKQALFDCETTDIKVLMGRMAGPIQFLMREDRFDVFVDHSFFAFMRDRYLRSLSGDGPAYQRQIIQLVGLIGKDGFFAPKPVAGQRHTSAEASRDLVQYLYLSNQIEALEADFRQSYVSSLREDDNLWEQMAKYRRLNVAYESKRAKLQAQLEDWEKELNKRIRLDDFLNNRAFLIGISNTLAGSLVRETS